MFQHARANNLDGDSTHQALSMLYPAPWYDTDQKIIKTSTKLSILRKIHPLSQNLTFNSVSVIFFSFFFLSLVLLRPTSWWKRSNIYVIISPTSLDLSKKATSCFLMPKAWNLISKQKMYKNLIGRYCKCYLSLEWNKN